MAAGTAAAAEGVVAVVGKEQQEEQQQEEEGPQFSALEFYSSLGVDPVTGHERFLCSLWGEMLLAEGRPRAQLSALRATEGALLREDGQGGLGTHAHTCEFRGICVPTPEERKAPAPAGVDRLRDLVFALYLYPDGGTLYDLLFAPALRTVSQTPRQSHGEQQPTAVSASFSSADLLERQASVRPPLPPGAVGEAGATQHAGLDQPDQLLPQQQGIGWGFRLAIAYHVALGLKHLHDRSVLHRDVRSSNLVFSEDWTCRLAGFGRAVRVADVLAPAHLHGMHGATGGDPDYAAPECIRGEDICGAMDVYSYGIVLVELITGKNIRHLLAQMSDCDAVGCDPEQLAQHFPSEAHPSLVELVRQCLDPDPSLRPTMDDVVEWIDSLITERENTLFGQASQAHGTRTAGGEPGGSPHPDHGHEHEHGQVSDHDHDHDHDRRHDQGHGPHGDEQLMEPDSAVSMVSPPPHMAAPQSPASTTTASPAPGAQSNIPWLDELPLPILPPLPMGDPASSLFSGAESAQDIGGSETSDQQGLVSPTARRIRDSGSSSRGSPRGGRALSFAIRPITPLDHAVRESMHALDMPEGTTFVARDSFCDEEPTLEPVEDVSEPASGASSADSQPAGGHSPNGKHTPRARSVCLRSSSIDEYNARFVYNSDASASAAEGGHEHASELARTTENAGTDADADADAIADSAVGGDILDAVHIRSMLEGDERVVSATPGSQQQQQLQSQAQTQSLPSQQSQSQNDSPRSARVQAFQARKQSSSRHSSRSESTKALTSPDPPTRAPEGPHAPPELGTQQASAGKNVFVPKASAMAEGHVTITVQHPLFKRRVTYCVCARASTDVMKRGEMFKKQKSMPLWKKRWFRLDGLTLFWSSSKENIDRPQLQHKFDLQHCLVENVRSSWAAAQFHICKDTQRAQRHQRMSLAPNASLHSHHGTAAGGNAGDGEQRDAAAGYKDVNALRLACPTQGLVNEWVYALRKAISMPRCEMCRAPIAEESLPESEVTFRSRSVQTAGAGPAAPMYRNLLCSEACGEFLRATAEHGLHISYGKALGGRLTTTPAPKPSDDSDSRRRGSRLAALFSGNEDGGETKQQPVSSAETGTAADRTATAMARNALRQEQPAAIAGGEHTVPAAELLALSSVRSWLAAIGCEYLWPEFERKRYDSFLHIKMAGLQEEDLAYLMIRNEAHRRCVFASAREVHMAYHLRMRKIGIEAADPFHVSLLYRPANRYMSGAVVGTEGHAALLHRKANDSTPGDGANGDRQRKPREEMGGDLILATDETAATARDAASPHRPRSAPDTPVGETASGNDAASGGSHAQHNKHKRRSHNRSALPPQFAATVAEVDNSTTAASVQGHVPRMSDPGAGQGEDGKQHHRTPELLRHLGHKIHSLWRKDNSDDAQDDTAGAASAARPTSGRRVHKSTVSAPIDGTAVASLSATSPPVEGGERGGSGDRRT